MSIEKKSLINTLKTARKANVVKEEVTVSGTTATPVGKRLARPSFASNKRAAAKKGLRQMFLAKKK